MPSVGEIIPGARPSGEAANLHQLETEFLDPVEEAVQRGLILHLTEDDRLDRLDSHMHLLESGAHRLPDESFDPDLIPVC